MTAVTAENRLWAWYWFPFAQLGWAAAAGGVWYLFPGLGAWPLFVGLLPWLVRLVVTGRSGRRTPFDVPLLLFLVTAGISLWAAYDPDGSRAVFAMPVGRRKLWGLMLSVLVYYSVTEFATAAQRHWFLILLAGFGTAVAVWFVVTNDWDANPGLWGPVTRLGSAIQSRLPYVPGHRLSPNVAGGLIALVSPMGWELTMLGRGRGQEREGRDGDAPHTRLGAQVWGWVTSAVMGFGLLLSGSRGAWLAVGGALCLAGAWWLAERLKGDASRLMVFAALVVAGSLLGIAAVAAIPSLRSTVLESQALLNRLNIFYQAAHLVRDYLFTGCGLGNFPLVHSTYVLLIHVPEMVFAHSTPLDVAVEQGMLGALALVVIWAGAAWVGMRRLAYSERWTAGLGAGLLSLAVLMLHGAVDSTIYGSRALLLFWMPVALILAASESPGDGAREVETDGAELPESPAGRPGQGQAEERAGPLGSGALAQWAAVGAAVLLFVGLLALLWRPLAASWYANLGAVHQTLVELRTYDYHHFDDPTLDEVRRRADLTRAVRAFERAVALDPGQVTARTRLAQIALARGEYESALEHAVAAWQAGYRDRVTRLVLADALVAQGRPEEAATLVSGLEFARSRLQGQAFSRYQQSGDWQRAAYALRAVLALDPDDAQARQAAEAAEAKAKGQ